MNAPRTTGLPAIQHVALNCRDRDRQERFYTAILGFQRVRTFNRGRPGEFVMLRLGDVCLELFPAGEGNARVTAGPQPVGFKHLAFEVPDLDAALDRVRAEGVEPGRVADCSGIAPGMRVCFFNDPEGNSVEFMQGYADE